MIHMLENVNKLILLPEACYHVFYRTGSNSRKKAQDKDYFPPVFTDIVRNSEVALDLVSRNHRELIPVALRFGFVQRLDYLLHIPISKMTSDNTFYKKVVSDLRRSFAKMLGNKYLSAKQKAYLTLLTLAPKAVRKLHAGIRGL